MSDESNLESKIKKSTLEQITDQYKQWRKEGNYLGDYFNNCIAILLGREPIDYTCISHNNKMNDPLGFGSTPPRNNILENSKIYDPETGKYR